MTFPFHTANSDAYAVADDAGGGVCWLFKFELRRLYEAAEGENGKGGVVVDSWCA